MNVSLSFFVGLKSELSLIFKKTTFSLSSKNFSNDQGMFYLANNLQRNPVTRQVRLLRLRLFLLYKNRFVLTQSEVSLSVPLII